MSKAASPVQACNSGVRVAVYAQPGARKTELSGLFNGAVKIRVQAAPLEGKANEELVLFLSRLFNVKRGAVSLLNGAKNRNKVFEINGVTLERAEASLLA